MFVSIPTGGQPLRRSDLVFDIEHIRAERESLLRRRVATAPPISSVLGGRASVVLAGRVYSAAELRLYDLAEMQRWVEEQIPHPMEGIPPAWADPEPATRRARLAAAMRRAEEWPPRPGSAEYGRLLGSTRGRAFFLALVLGAAHPDLTADDLVEMAVVASPAEWAALERVAYAMRPGAEIVAELAPPELAAGHDWGTSIYAAVVRYGFTFEELGRLTLSQWRNLCTEGKGGGSDKAAGLRHRRASAMLKEAEREPAAPDDIGEGPPADDSPGPPAADGIVEF